MDRIHYINTRLSIFQTFIEPAIKKSIDDPSLNIINEIEDYLDELDTDLNAGDQIDTETKTFVTDVKKIIENNTNDHLLIIEGVWKLIFNPLTPNHEQLDSLIQIFSNPLISNEGLFSATNDIMGTL